MDGKEGDLLLELSSIWVLLQLPVMLAGLSESIPTKPAPELFSCSGHEHREPQFEHWRFLPVHSHSSNQST